MKEGWHVMLRHVFTVWSAFLRHCPSWLGGLASNLQQPAVTLLAEQERAVS